MKLARGLTLVELLVAMAIVLVVVAGSLAFVARGRDAWRTSESVAALEEILDAGFALLTEEVRLAGYLGLAPSATGVEGAAPIGTAEPPDLAVAGACGPSLALDLANPVVAIDAGYAAAPGHALGCRPSPAGRHRPGADTLVLRHAAAAESRPQSGRLQLETSLRSARLAANGVGSLASGARWHDLEVGVYYVSADSTGRTGWPALRRKRLVGGTRPAFQDEEIASGIADLQVEIGLDTVGDGDLAVDRWIRPGEPAGDAVARALRLELEAVVDAPPAHPEAARRKRVRRVVDLRNHGALP